MSEDSDRGEEDEVRPNYYLAPVRGPYVTELPPIEGEPDIYEVECQGLIEGLECNFNIGSVWKYLFRAGKKEGEAREKDLRKALTYLKFEVRRLES